MKDGELVITHNDNEIISPQKVATNHELQNIQNYLVKANESSLKLERLKELSNSSQISIPNSPETDYIPWIIGSVLIFALLGTVIIISKAQRKKTKIK